MTTNARNLGIAQQAITYVESKMTIGADNKWSDKFASLFAAETSGSCVARIRKSPYPSPRLEQLREMARRALIAGCGNCGEQAAIAFFWLHDRKVAPLEYMTRTNADHAFVVIGRKLDSSFDKPLEWGENCIICDPWAGKVYTIRNVSKKMYGSGPFDPRTVYRFEPEEGQ
ncbi:hypothetical protein ACR30L_14905 [Psychromonas sp. PT13]|uniref:hypothetical protein n=1 Tax=Psychromonas sp. PT13 TaxID=3439547 RepID=UPI003EBF16BE